MGWLFKSNHDKAALVADLVRQLQPNLIAHRVVGNHFWAVVNDDANRRYIFLALMQGGRQHGWGYKDMDEDMGPYYYDCPLSLLDLAGDALTPRAAQWRETVRKYHAKKKAHKSAIKPGALVKYGPHTYRLDTPIPRRGWEVTRLDGSPFRMKAKQVAEAEVLG